MPSSKPVTVTCPETTGCSTGGMCVACNRCSGHCDCLAQALLAGKYDSLPAKLLEQVRRVCR